MGRPLATKNIDRSANIPILFFCQKIRLLAKNIEVLRVCTFERVVLTGFSRQFQAAISEVHLLPSQPYSHFQRNTIMEKRIIADLFATKLDELFSEFNEVVTSIASNFETDSKAQSLSPQLRPMYRDIFELHRKEMNKFVNNQKNDFLDQMETVMLEATEDLSVDRFSSVSEADNPLESYRPSSNVNLNQPGFTKPSDGPKKSSPKKQLLGGLESKRSTDVGYRVGGTIKRRELVSFLLANGYTCSRNRGKEDTYVNLDSGHRISVNSVHGSKESLIPKGTAAKIRRQISEQIGHPIRIVSGKLVIDSQVQRSQAS